MKEPPRETVSSTAIETVETVGGQLSKSSSADSAVEATEELVGETVDEVGKTVVEVTGDRGAGGQDRWRGEDKL